MSARIADQFVIYNSKRYQVPFVGTPTHGANKWIRDGEKWLQIFYFKRDGYGCDWLPLEEFRRKEKDFRRRRYEHHQANPWILREKINARRNGNFVSDLI